MLGVNVDITDRKRSEEVLLNVIGICAKKLPIAFALSTRCAALKSDSARHFT